MSLVSTNLNYCRLLNGTINFATLQVTVSYVLGTLAGGVHTDHPALTAVGQATLGIAGLSRAGIQAAIKAVEPSIDFAGGDALIG